MRAALPRLFAVALACLGASSDKAFALEPYQLVRSLQLVQDRIAAGDSASLPMQRKLLAMIDARLGEATEAELAKERNFNGLLVYGMSGGNPATIEAVLSKINPDNAHRGLADGVLSYLRGRPQHAATALASVDPMKFDPELGAFLALVKGSLLAPDDPKAALKLLDIARLLSPGALVEEAALRRSVVLHTALHDPQRFLWAAQEYVRRYLRSPYASQFADGFVAGVIALHDVVPLSEVETVAALMDPEQEKVIYLRIARRAAIDGLKTLSAFAAAKAEALQGLGGEPDDPRALLYASLSTVTTEPAEVLRARLATIDRSRLSVGDQRLLDAVDELAGELNADVSVDPTLVKAGAEPKSSEPADSQPTSEAMPVDPASKPLRETKVASPEAAAAPPEPSEPAVVAGEGADAPTDARVAQARKVIGDIDEILKAAR